MNQVSRDGDYLLVQVPEKDLDSMIRFIAHGLVMQENNAINLCHEIVTGDLTKQDDYVKDLKRLFDLENYSIVLDGPEALALCDELAEKVYEEKPQVPGLLYKICVHCHKSYAGKCECPEFKRAQMRLVK